MVKFTKEQKDQAEADEVLAALLVKPTITFSDLGGLSTVVKQLREMIEWPLKFASIFEFLGVTPPNGILLSGPAGTGKTTLANAIAGENPDIPCFRINAPELVSGLSGKSEEKIR